MSDTQLVTNFVSNHPYWVLIIGAACYASLLLGLVMAFWPKGLHKDDK